MLSNGLQIVTNCTVLWPNWSLLMSPVVSSTSGGTDQQALCLPQLPLSHLPLLKYCYWPCAWCSEAGSGGRTAVAVAVQGICCPSLSTMAASLLFDLLTLPNLVSYTPTANSAGWPWKTPGSPSSYCLFVWDVYLLKKVIQQATDEDLIEVTWYRDGTVPFWPQVQ